MSEKPFRVFLSYSRHDDSFVLEQNNRLPEFRRILKGLESSQVQVVVDADILRCGDTWRPSLEAELQTCDALIAVLSDDFLQSPNCMREVQFMRDRNRKIFPLYYRYCVLSSAPALKGLSAYPNQNQTIVSLTSPDMVTQRLIEFREQIRAHAMGERG